MTRSPAAGRRPAPTAKKAQTQPRRVARRLWPFLASVVVVGILVVGVFPTRTFLAQRAALSRAEEQLAVLEEQNDELDRRADLLRSDAEIERLARERYNLVRPGEEAYAVLPPPGSPTTSSSLPPLGDADSEGDRGRNPLQRAWDAVVGLF